MKKAISVPLISALLAFALPAEAQTPRLKPAVTVTSDVVRIGDLIDNAGLAASTAIFRAPDLGQTGPVPAVKVLDIVLRYGLVTVDTQGITEVQVTRASRTVSAKDIEARIARALAGRYSLGETRNVAVAFDRDARPLQLDPAITGDLEVVRMSYDASSRRFDIAFEIPDPSAGRRVLLRYTGLAYETVEAAVIAQPLARGELVKASNVTIERRPKSEFGGEAPAPANEVIGMAAKRAVRANSPLRTADLMKPELVQKNDTVLLLYEAPGMMLTMRGKAVDSGAEGDTVSVINLQSKRTIQGTVTGPGRVTVTAVHSVPRVAASLEPPAPAEPQAPVR
jgi:flagella basal body P-ring formation protein FlgA